MIQMLRKEACSGAIDDLAHVVSKYCLADCLTKNSAKPDELLAAVNTGKITSVDMPPSFRSLMKHKAYLAKWIVKNTIAGKTAVTFLAEPIDMGTPMLLG